MVRNGNSSIIMGPCLIGLAWTWDLVRLLTGFLLAPVARP